MNYTFEHGFGESIQNIIQHADQLSEKLSTCTKIISEKLIQHHKLWCYDNTALPLSNYISELLLSQFNTPRPSLPAIALGHNDPLKATLTLQSFAQPEDILLILSGEDSIANQPLINHAQEYNMSLIEIGGSSPPLYDEHIVMGKNSKTEHQLENQIILIHQLCHAIESQLFGIHS